MTEDFLHYLWANRLCYQTGLSTIDGQYFEIIHPGVPNTDAGPDFFNAKIKIGTTLWAGNVEIHIRENDWVRHAHDTDAAYDNVILHVVQEKGNKTLNSSGKSIPVWEMVYDKDLLYNYNRLLSKASFVACEHYLHRISQFEMNLWLERVLIERIQTKGDDISRYLTLTNNDWGEVFFILLARSFGFGVNGDPFEILARQTPFKILLRHADSLLQLEAVLLGQSGLLDNVREDAYVKQLKKEYFFLAHKYGLKKMDGHLWRFLRLRPSNFPTIRLVQLAGILHQTRGRFEDFIHHPATGKWERAFQITASEYWDNHYKPGVLSDTVSVKRLGIASAHVLIINAVVPYSYMYARAKDNEDLGERALKLLSELPPEKNSIVDAWARNGFPAEDAYSSQAMIFLKKSYCNHKKCLSCRIGHKLISSKQA